MIYSWATLAFLVGLIVGGLVIIIICHLQILDLSRREEAADDRWKSGTFHYERALEILKKAQEKEETGRQSIIKVWYLILNIARKCLPTEVVSVMENDCPIPKDWLAQQEKANG